MELKRYTCQPDQVPGTFDLIAMIHVLEHIPAPRDFIVKLWNKLALDGLLVIEVPNYLRNPFDLLVADHCTHFTVTTITELIQNAGFEIISVTTDWVPKELTIVARKSEDWQMNKTSHATYFSLESTVKCLQWLELVVASARKISTKGAFGLFGTSIAATWLFSELGGPVNFFVDEDLNRAGKTYMGRPIYYPCEVPRNSHVFIALPNWLAKSVQTRMKTSKFDFNCYVPPPFFR